MAEKNALDIVKDLNWLKEVIEYRLEELINGTESNEEMPPAPILSKDESLYAKVVSYYKMSWLERILLIVALAPHVSPQVLDYFFVRNDKTDRGFTELGGIKGNQFSGFLPTGETVAFLYAGNNLTKRFELLALFDSSHFFKKHDILQLKDTAVDEPILSGTLQLSSEYVSYFTIGEPRKPDYSVHFPAKLISTPLSWEDLILSEQTLEELNEIQEWITYGSTLMEEWGLKKKLKRGYRSLFYGPPGTGKTLSACLLGKTTGLDVYRIDLSMVVSKYVGETEKNLSSVFDKAEHKNWILFFDEADALFGRRTQTSSSNDRYANQEVSYLLQRIEDFPGIVILCSNLKANIDEAFSRRFQSMIHFGVPEASERLQIWIRAFPEHVVLEPQIDLKSIADQYVLTGGAIINISRYACLKSIVRGEKIIRNRDILTAIRREYHKDGKTSV